MVELILGNYFIAENIIDKEIIDKCIMNHQLIRSKIGVIAVEEGMITEKQSEVINRLQATKDMRFGDVAVDRDYLREEQVKALLEKQENAYELFKKILLKESKLDENVYDDIIGGFKKKYGFSDSDFEEFKSDETEKIIPLFLSDGAEKYKDLVTIMIKNLIRLVDTQVYIGKAYKCSCEKNDLQVTQKIVSKENIIDGFYEVTGGLLELCSSFGIYKFEELNQDALCEAAEFLNCTNGLYSSMLNQKGLATELRNTVLYAEKTKIEELYCIPVYLKNKEFIFFAGDIK